MQVLVALTVGLLFWVVAWGLGIKALDAFLVTIAIVVGAAAMRAFLPFVRQQLGRE